MTGLGHIDKNCTKYEDIDFTLIVLSFYLCGNMINMKSAEEGVYYYKVMVHIYYYIYHDFLPPPRGSLVKSDNIQPIAIYNCAIFTVYPNRIRNGIPVHGIPSSHQHGRVVRKNTGPRKNGRVKLIQLHMYQGPPLIPIFHVLSLSLHRHSFTPSIQPNLGLPRTRPPLTSAINTLTVTRCSSILSHMTSFLAFIKSLHPAIAQVNFLCGLAKKARSSNYFASLLANLTLHLKSIHRHLWGNVLN